ncbi:hypothetical protein DASC09_048710 [Saccharomycopsis crataegensis]|uniref:F-box domain-containing protein n=1 Tax=Saccharomycopsis crataegensis TaxID=43959 RepID=A0AAV5QSJ6_9ASCO|nr:hypothetical protein DASC09_048710 [Saccharomycopsis crataegensis]
MDSFPLTQKQTPPLHNKMTTVLSTLPTELIQKILKFVDQETLVSWRNKVSPEFNKLVDLQLFANVSLKPRKPTDWNPVRDLDDLFFRDKWGDMAFIDGKNAEVIYDLAEKFKELSIFSLDPEEPSHAKSVAELISKASNLRSLFLNCTEVELRLNDSCPLRNLKLSINEKTSFDNMNFNFDNLESLSLDSYDNMINSSSLLKHKVFPNLKTFQSYYLSDVYDGKQLHMPNLKIFTMYGEGVITLKNFTRDYFPNLEEISGSPDGCCYDESCLTMDFEGVYDIPSLRIISTVGKIINCSPVSRFEGLKEFDVSFSGFENIPDFMDESSEAPKLIDLALCVSEISKMENLESLIYLENLNLEEAHLKKIQNLENLTRLKTLLLVTNEITKIECLENLTMLKSLLLAGNKITKIEGLETLVNLEKLQLGANKLTKIEGLENLTNLKSLDLSYNSCSKIEGLGNLVKLESLNLNGNQNIGKIEGLDSLTSLTYLGLSRNRIEKIEGLQNLKNLRELDLSHNLISQFENLETQTQLEHIFLGNNKISDISNFPIFSSLTRADLKSNDITAFDIDLSKFQKLESFDLNFNPIEAFKESVPDCVKWTAESEKKEKNCSLLFS